MKLSGRLQLDFGGEFRGTSHLLSLLLNGFITWTSGIVFFSAHEQFNVKICERVVNTWGKFCFY